MSYGIEAYVDGVPFLYTGKPFNLAYALKIKNPQFTTGTNKVNIPIAPVIDGKLIVVVADLGWYDKVVDMGGTTLCTISSLELTSTNVALKLTSRLSTSGKTYPPKDIVLSFFVRHSL